MAAARVLRDPGFQLALCGVVGLAIVGVLPIGFRRRRVVAGLVGVVALAELGWCGRTLIRVAPADQFAGADPIGEAILRQATLWRSPGDAPSSVQPPVRIKARDAFYGDLPAAKAGIEKTNVDDAFQLDRPAALYETLYPIASRVRPMAERLMSPATKDRWKRIRQAVLDRMSVEFIVSDRVEAEPAWPVAVEGDRAGSPYVILRNRSVAAPRLRRPACDGPARRSRRRAPIADGDRPALERHHGGRSAE